MTYTVPVTVRQGEVGAWFYHYADFVIDFDAIRDEVTAEAS